MQVIDLNCALLDRGIGNAQTGACLNHLKAQEMNPNKHSYEVMAHLLITNASLQTGEGCFLPVGAGGRPSLISGSPVIPE